MHRYNGKRAHAFTILAISMQCEICNINEAVQEKWRWNLCDGKECILKALTGPSKFVSCDFCPQRSMRYFWEHETCGSHECNEKARDGRIPEDFGNLALTTFGKNDSKRASAPKYTAKQERKWGEVCGDIGFNQDGTMKT